tara:strand:- start:2050 stop:2256 length:207 start_codon:yes stop_codon:yes gene_type:complete
MYKLGDDRVVKTKNSTTRKSLKNILSEYKIKMNSFHPKDDSPNKFVNKLEYRMKHYYNLYKSKNDITK